MPLVSTVLLLLLLALPIGLYLSLVLGQLLLIPGFFLPVLFHLQSVRARHITEIRSVQQR